MFCRKCLIERKADIAGQGFTPFQCKKCGQSGFWHNTNVPSYCLSCSDNNLICAHCGKDMIVEVIENLKDSMSLYDIALEIGTSESSLRKYMTKGSIGPRVYKKLKDFVWEYLEEKRGSYNG